MKTKKFNCINVITEVKEVAKDIYSIILQDDKIPANSSPGQFLMVQVDNESTIPLLRRAFSISRIIDDNHYQLLIQQVGIGTKILGNKIKGQSLGILGPLGSSYNLKKADGKDVIIVAGGIGVAPVFFLYDQLKGIANSITIYYGAKSKENLVEINNLDANIKISTENGSFGEKGFVTQCLLNDIHSNSFNESNTIVYSCGPTPMLAALGKVVEGTNIYCEVSVENEMACGMGVCMGCPVELKNNPGNYVYACKEGPVFNINDIIL